MRLGYPSIDAYSAADSGRHHHVRQAEVQNNGSYTLKGTLDFDYKGFAILSDGLTKTMRQKYAQCKQMMEISDEEIDAYREQREQIDKGMSEEESTEPSFNKILQLQNSIDSAKSKLKLE